MVYAGINFNSEYWAGRPVEHLLAHEAHHGLPEKQLREAWQLMQPKQASSPTGNYKGATDKLVKAATNDNKGTGDKGKKP